MLSSNTPIFLSRRRVPVQPVQDGGAEGSAAIGCGARGAGRGTANQSRDPRRAAAEEPPGGEWTGSERRATSAQTLTQEVLDFVALELSCRL